MNTTTTNVTDSAKMEFTGKITLFEKSFDNDFYESLDILKTDKAWSCHENLSNLDFNTTSAIIAQRGRGANMISVWNRGTDYATKKWPVDFGVRIGAGLYNIPAIQVMFNNAKTFNYKGKKEYRVSFSSLKSALQCAYTITYYEGVYNAKKATKEVDQVESVTA